MPATAPKLTAALTHSQRRGFHVFPLKPREKTPLTDNGHKDATRDEATVRAWWDKWPAANIGISTGASGIVAIDVDGPEGEQSLVRWEAENGPLPWTVTAYTGNGGKHLIFRAPDGPPLKPAKHIFGPSTRVDVRAGESYIVGAGSTHPNGQPYQWAKDAHPATTEMAELPANLLALLRGERLRERVADLPPVIHEGSRDDSLFRFACAMRRIGATESEILAAADTFNAERCSPPLSSRDVAEKVRSAMKYEPDADITFRELQHARADSSPATDPFITAAEQAKEIAAPLEFVAPPYVARNCITNLTARVKGGKTTFALAMVAAVLRGDTFLDRWTSKGPVVYLTEERKTSFRAALQRAGIDQEPGLHILYRNAVMRRDWAQVVALAANKCEEVGACLLVVDTVPRWARVAADDENAAGAVRAAMEPLETAAARGLAVVATFHARKGGGSVGEATRGSGEWDGTADVLLLLGKPSGGYVATMRELEAEGRLDVPDKVLINLDKGRYVVESDKGRGPTEAERARMWILAHLRTVPAGATAREILDEAQLVRLRRTAITDTLATLTTEGVLARERASGRGGAMRYWIPFERQPRLEVIQ